MNDGTDICVALASAPDRRVAERIASTIVEEHLAACVNIVAGIVSIYRWQDTMHREPEVLLVIKTTCEAFDALSRRISELHPYDIPEVLQLPVQNGLTDYLGWVAGEVSVG
ncbi:MAG: divalent-cation tolerance protein CutA [Candidatus Dadabacteria bacterium]|nr:MAG: divalent-cation tolerance protein CutA [Candidatus Dadabacteria bacterium]